MPCWAPAPISSIHRSTGNDVASPSWHAWTAATPAPSRGTSPVQLVVADRLRDLRKEMPLGQWIADHAGPLAQLDDIFSEYEHAQLDAARANITDDDHRTVTLLLSGHLEAS